MRDTQSTLGMTDVSQRAGTRADYFAGSATEGEVLIDVNWTETSTHTCGNRKHLY